MRNVAVHRYDDVDADLVWATITASVPEFVALLQAEPRIAAPAPESEPPRQAPLRGSARFPEDPYSSQTCRWRSGSRVLTLPVVPGSPASTVG